MPIPSAKSYLGLSKDSVNTAVASGGVAAGATTVTVLSSTGITASSTIFIADGPLSESRAVTGVAGNVLTVAALTNAHPGFTYVYAQPTASVGPTDYIPVTGDPDFMDNYAQHDDKGNRGSLVETFGRVQGVAHSEFSIAGDVFTDTIGYLVGLLFGSVDFSGGTPNTFAFGLKNTGDCQPTPFVFYEYDGVETRAYPGCKLEELAFKLDPAGLLTWTAKGRGFLSGVVANPTSSFSGVAPLPAWTGLATIGGTALQTVISAEFTLKRAVLSDPTLASNLGPYKVFGGEVSAAGKLVVVVEDNSQLLNYINNSQPSLDLTATSGSGATQNYFQVHCTKAAYGRPKRTRGKPYMELDIPFDGIANTTDATAAGTGYSPAKITTKSTKATGTYL